jgi:predicted HTH transcriptional regulator
LIEANGTITTRDLTQKTGMSQRTLLRELSTLQEIGVLVREGGRKGGRWIIKQLTE